jgi:hypothetical protein
MPIFNIKKHSRLPTRSFLSVETQRSLDYGESRPPSRRICATPSPQRSRNFAGYESNPSCPDGTLKYLINVSQMLHVWYIYLYLGDF